MKVEKADQWRIQIYTLKAKYMHMFLRQLHVTLPFAAEIFWLRN